MLEYEISDYPNRILLILKIIVIFIYLFLDDDLKFFRFIYIDIFNFQIVQFLLIFDLIFHIILTVVQILDFMSVSNFKYVVSRSITSCARLFVSSKLNNGQIIDIFYFR